MAPADHLVAANGVPSRRSSSSAAGLPTSGAVALAVGAAIGGGAVDVVTGPGLRAIFAVSFIAGCVLAAAFVRRRGLAAAVVMPPLVYILIAIVAGAVDAGPATGSWFMRQVYELVTALITGAPVLLAATGAAALVAGIRLTAFHGTAPAMRHLPRGS